MVAQVETFAFHGVEAQPVTVQVQMTGGANAFTIVGLPDKAVSEARERVRAALSAVGLGLPVKRITVNLAPADLPKEGSYFDLPIAMALLMEIGALPRDAADGFAVIGELGLDGGITAVTGALPAAVAANSRGLGLICPQQSGPEAAWAGNASAIIAPASLIQLVNHLKGTQVLTAPEPGGLAPEPPVADMRDVRGQETAKRALEIAAAGGHNLLMVGPPGAGKSMLAARLPGLLPPLDAEEMLEVSMVQSFAGLLDQGKLTRARPFRAPHHSASMAAMVGGGIRARPGEASLAHHGVLFLDELPEFAGTVLDSLRQPLETGDVLIARANYHVRYPARFQLIAAMNPCRCGYGRASGRNCGRGPNCEAQYQSLVATQNAATVVDIDSTESLELEPGIVRIRGRHEPESGPPAPAGPDSAPLAGSAVAPYATAPQVMTNAAMPDSMLEKVGAPDADGAQLLVRATEALNLSARGYHRILRTARTLADLDGSDSVRRRHIAEAVSFRRRGPDTQPAAAMGAATV